MVNGPPWRTTVCVLFTVRAHDADGRVVYDNRAILFARAKWGKIYYHEDFEDTHKSQAFAEHLARVAAQADPAPSGPGSAILADSSGVDGPRPTE